MHPVAVLLLPTSAQAACGASTHAEVLAAAKEADAAFSEAAPERVLAAAEQARGALPCVGALLVPEEVGVVHRLFALEAFVRRDVEGAGRWFEASRAAQPDYVIPASALPERHPIRSIYDASVPKTRGEELLAPGRGTRTWVDGVPTAAVPLGRPTVVQTVATEGVQTYLRPDGGPPPELGVSRTGAERGDARPRTVLSIGVSGVAANHDDGPWGYGGPHVRAHVPLAGALFAEAMVQMPLTAADVAAAGGGTERAVLGLPMAQLGLVGRAQGDAIVPWGGAGLLLLSDVDGPMAGAGAGVGVDVPLGALRLTPELRAGWTTGPRLGGVPLLGLGIGAGVAL